MESNNKIRLIAFILVGMSLIPIGDSAGKILTLEGASPAFVAWSRLLVGFLFILPFSGLRPAEMKQLFHWQLLIRAALFTGAIFCMISALQTEPIANVFGIFFIGPIIAYFLAVVLLKEKISYLRSMLLMIGFVGVLMVVKPGVDFTTGSLLAVVAGVCYGCLLVANRWLAGKFRPRLILLSTLLVGSVALMPKGLEKLPLELNAWTVTLLLVSALASAVGNLIIIEANRRLDAATVAPFVYSQLVAASVLGVLLFNEIPDVMSLLGLLIIFVSGVLSFVYATEKKQV